MTVEAWTITPEYTISGTGPYAITHPYKSGSIVARVRLDTGLLLLNNAEFSVSPVSADVEGNMTLSPTVATTYAGRKLLIDRVTPDEQGWVAVLGEREAGLAAQLDRMVQATQELRARSAGALRIRGQLDAFDWDDGTIPIRDGARVKSGPTAADIAGAQDRATEAAASAAAAAASAAEALARELSMLRDRGNWVTALLYSPSDIVTINGSAYICIVSHFATVFATDLAGAKWRLFAAKGDAGAGTGDMLKTENLSGLTNVPQARTNIGLGGLAVKTLAAFADLDPSAIISDVEGLFANKTVANAVPVAKAVAEAMSAYLIVVDQKASADGGTFNSGAFRTRDLNTVRANTITGASVAANQITLPAGTFLIEAKVPGYRCGIHQARLYNVTDAGNAIWGTVEHSVNTDACVTSSEIVGILTLAAPKVFEIQHVGSTTQGTNGFGIQRGGGADVYTQISIQRIG